LPRLRRWFPEVSERATDVARAKLETGETPVNTVYWPLKPPVGPGWPYQGPRTYWYPMLPPREHRRQIEEIGLSNTDRKRWFPEKPIGSSWESQRAMAELGSAGPEITPQPAPARSAPPRRARGAINVNQTMISVASIAAGLAVGWAIGAWRHK
jgi:hypothetical protein